MHTWLRRALNDERVLRYADAVLEPLDAAARALNGKSNLPPLRVRRNSGALSTFETSAASVLGFVNGAVGLKPTDRILDIGCGAGAIALQLVGYLEDGGSYTGIDIHRPSIRWARRSISRRDSRFHFELADVASLQYNPQGRGSAADYHFPFADAAFDLALLKSVFTHLRPPEVENYVREVARMLATGGHSLMTFFLLGEDRDQLIAAGRSLDFPHGEGPWRYHDAETPERASAFDEQYILSLLDSNGLVLARPVLHGYQDVVLVRRS